MYPHIYLITMHLFANEDFYSYNKDTAKVFFFNIFKWCNVIGTRNIIRLSIHLLGFIDLLGEERALIEMITYKKL